MKVILEREDFKSISATVIEQLRDIFKDKEFVTDNFVQNSQLIFGPEFMATPLRISTPSTEYDFNDSQLEFVKRLRKEIDASPESTKKEKKEKEEKKQLLESTISYGQLLFAQSASFHFLDKVQRNPALNLENDVLNKEIKNLWKFIDDEGIRRDKYSKRDTLERRKKFIECTDIIKAEIKQAIKSTEDPGEKQELRNALSDLKKTQQFYFQANDLNFKYANKPSRSFSTFVNNCEKYGGRLGLAASIIAIGATALSFIPPLAPIMVPIAFIASMTALAISTPLAFKNIGTMLYNLIKYKTEPTPKELINATLYATSLIFAGVGPIVSSAASIGAVSKTASMATKGVSFAHSIGKTGFGVTTQVSNAKNKGITEKFKSELLKNKSSSNPDATEENDSGIRCK